jgi:hypothetical protein
MYFTVQSDFLPLHISRINTPIHLEDFLQSSYKNFLTFVPFQLIKLSKRALNNKKKSIQLRLLPDLHLVKI